MPERAESEDEKQSNNGDGAGGTHPAAAATRASEGRARTSAVNELQHVIGSPLKAHYDDRASADPGRFIELLAQLEATEERPEVNDRAQRFKEGSSASPEPASLRGFARRHHHGPTTWCRTRC